MAQAVQPQKTAVITGAYRGLGLESARLLIQKGYGVVMTARDVAKARQAAEKLAKEMGGITWAVAMDVTNDASLASAFREVSGLIDHLDVLINNAAIFPDPSKGPLNTQRDLLEDAFKTNVAGALRAAQTFLPLLKKGKGRIVNVSSGLGALGEMQNQCTAYSLSKAALNAVTRQLSAELSSEGIPVNSVCPGWCRTEMGGENAPRSVTEGAEGIVWVAAEAPKELTGHFLRDHKEIPW